MTGPGARDWDKEMAEIDKIIARTPPAHGGAVPAPVPRAPTSAAPAPAPRERRGGALGTWLRVGLGVLLAAGMTQWPYFHACGTGLFAYLGAVGVVILAGIWGAVSSWRRQAAAAHLASLLVIVAGGVLAAGEVLPRVGYAKHSAVWWCP